jgi:hypothetical protein
MKMLNRFVCDIANYLNESTGSLKQLAREMRHDGTAFRSAPRLAKHASRFFKVLSVAVNKTRVTFIKGFFDLESTKEMYQFHRSLADAPYYTRYIFPKRIARLSTGILCQSQSCQKPVCAKWFINTYINIQSVAGGMCQTSGGCSLC